MMVDIGTGIAIAGVAIAAAPVAITALRSRGNNGNLPKACSLHSGIEATLESLSNSMEVVQADIKELLKRG
jgi:tRNA1(Val) A37 N6-methylase TrmN6